jgi:hypothetical protein
MRSWTKDERARQALLIQQWKPWTKAGVKTPEGKAISCMNAYKHGAYCAAMKSERKALVEQRYLLRWLKDTHPNKELIVPNFSYPD